MPIRQDILVDLTDEQREAVLHRQGPLLVVAGAGTGKTRVITRRVAALVDSGVPAGKILAITFTNKAASEMRQRIRALVGNAATVSTFHSFCARVLRRHGKHLGLSPRYVIFDDPDQLAAVTEATELAKVDKASWPPRTLLSGISDAKNKMLTPVVYEERATSPKKRAIAAVYPEYQRILRERDAVDFDDLLVLTVDLFTDHDEVRQRWAGWFEYVLVDEYQDTNHPQYLLTMLLTKDHRNICVTGDPDQAIYGWRGADIRNILDFERDYKDAKVVTLTNNFRSTQGILDAANNIIRYNISRKEKNLRGVKGVGRAVELKKLRRGQDEAHFVGRRIYELYREGVSLSEIAILYRANFQSRSLEEALVFRGVPHRVYGAVAFYQRKEIKDLLAYLRVVSNPHDDFGAMRIVNVPPRRIGRATLEKLNKFRRERNLSFFEAARRCQEIETLGRAPRKALLTWVELIDELQADAKDRPVDGIIRSIIERVAYTDYLSRLYPGEELDRLDNVRALVDGAAEFERKGEGADSTLEVERALFPDALDRIPLLAYLEHVALVSAQDEMDDSQPRVSLMTIHTAKGLEFAHVYLVGLEDGVFPVSLALEREDGIEEERRLAYVAITRAKTHLTVSYAESRRRWGDFNLCQPSPFLEEAGLLKTFGGWRQSERRRSRWDEDSQVSPYDDEDDFEAEPRERRPKAPKSKPETDLDRFVDQLETKPRPTSAQLRETRAALSNRVARSAGKRGESFAVGDRVIHEHFGPGDVCSVSGRGAATRVRVAFDEHGEKTLVLQYSRLTKVEA